MADRTHSDMARQGREVWNAFVNAQGSDFRADLSNATLEKAKLPRANLRGADLSGAGLRRADLTGARLSLADLEGADLTGANLRGAQLSGSNLRMADLGATNLTRADLSGANLERARLGRASLAATDLTKTDLRRADLSGARDIEKARLRDAGFDAVTRWPAGFDPLAAGAVPAGSEQEPTDPAVDPATGLPAPVVARVPTLDHAAQSEVRRRLEPITGELHQVALDDLSLSDEEQAYLRGQLGTLREQLRLEVDGDTRIIELALANITTRFAERLDLGNRARDILEEIGTRPPELIEEIIDRLNRELHRTESLGSADPIEDAQTLHTIGSSMDRLEDLVTDLVDQMEGHVVSRGIRNRSAARGFFGGLATSLAASGVEGSWQGLAVQLLTALKDLLRWLTSAA